MARSKKCPPNVFCIRNVSIVTIGILVGVAILGLMSLQSRMSSVSSGSNGNGGSSGTHPNHVMNTMNANGQPMIPMVPGFLSAVNHPGPIQMERPMDAISDPRHPPLKDTAQLYGHGMHAMMHGGGGHGPVHMPINQPTQAPYAGRSASSSYSQIGILTRTQGEKILPLMGRPSQIQRNKWQYYTMSDGNQSIRLPVSRSGRSCTSDNGCDEIMNGDSVYVEGYGDSFRATVYENDAPRYLPHVL